ncbi:uncharacterized protein [Rutidosis leptorrhynchoides]|uniref:uncharacterized protein n=1 Tax=Rutidosis leptorrhynchoides TaxID=125765 RepID=UPI003A9A650E
MVTTKGDAGSAVAGTGDTTTIQPSSECCMCGDHGFLQELFRCIICKFRSQHTYCSNFYPKAESYKVCNWCLTDQKQVSGGNSSNSSSSGKKSSGEGCRDNAGKNKSNPSDRRKGLEIKVTTNTCMIKKVRGSRSPGELPASTGRRRVGAGEENNKHVVVLRKSKSANHLTNGGGGGSGSGIKTRPVFRNKVRRYKLLEEVSSQSEVVII